MKMKPCCKEHVKTPYDISKESMGLHCLMSGYESESRVCPTCHTTLWRARTNESGLQAIKDGNSELHWGPWRPYSYQPNKFTLREAKGYASRFTDWLKRKLE